jgi:hypothetical protein
LRYLNGARTAAKQVAAPANNGRFCGDWLENDGVATQPRISPNERDTGKALLIEKN